VLAGTSAEVATETVKIDELPCAPMVVGEKEALPIRTLPGMGVWGAGGGVLSLPFSKAVRAPLTHRMAMKSEMIVRRRRML
jgi:hypothetical protein